MTFRFGPADLIALGASATAAATYLDICDMGAIRTRLDPAHYRNCGVVLFHIFSMVDAHLAFPSLLEHSAAARETYEAIRIAQRLEISKPLYYPQLTALLLKVAA